MVGASTLPCGRPPPPHISSSECLTRRTLAQLRTNKSPFLKVYVHKFDAKTHPSPLCPLCNTHIHDTHHLFNCTPIRTPGFVDRPSRSECTAGQMDGEAGWWSTSRKMLQRRSHDCIIDCHECLLLFPVAVSAFIIYSGLCAFIIYSGLCACTGML